MNETFIKLYRKIKDHDILRDSNALQVFIWILISVDYKTGKMISGRFWGSSALGMNPNTFYKVLKRLEKKYDLVTLSSNNKNTTILVKNWNKYQSDGSTTSNNKVTTKEQQSNTNQEYKNKRIKEYIYTFNSLFNSNYQITKGRGSKLEARLKTYEFSQILEALEILSKSDFHRGENERGWKADPDFLIKNDEMIDKWLNKKVEENHIKSKGKKIIPFIELKGNYDK